ncbi:hypothetical protein EDD86DRAFT_17328 [Gorgonomyces haynaldii]|nr:hypothetical protein EDD86DRAFT_17328 [Gorgonomyces haynaldii]
MEIFPLGLERCLSKQCTLSDISNLQGTNQIGQIPVGFLRLETCLIPSGLCASNTELGPCAASCTQTRPIGLIVGCTVGGVMILLFVIVGCCIHVRRRKRSVPKDALPIVAMSVPTVNTEIPLLDTKEVLEMAYVAIRETQSPNTLLAHSLDELSCVNSSAGRSSVLLQEHIVFPEHPLVEVEYATSETSLESHHE